MITVQSNNITSSEADKLRLWLQHTLKTSLSLSIDMVGEQTVFYYEEK